MAVSKSDRMFIIGAENECDSREYEIKEEGLMPVSVRGVDYRVNMEKLDKHRETRLYHLAQLWKQPLSNGQQRAPLYIDRNPLTFQCILDFYSTGDLHLPEALCGGQVMAELDYWGIAPVNIAPCCLLRYKNIWDSLEMMTEITGIYNSKKQMRENATTRREKLYVLMSQPNQTLAGKVMYVCLAVVYVAFLVSMFLQSLPDFRLGVGTTASVNSTKESEHRFHLNTRLVPWLAYLDLVLLSILTMYTIIILVVGKRSDIPVVTYIGMFAVIMQWFPVLASAFFSTTATYYKITRLIQAIKILRIIPIFSILRPLKSMQILFRALQASRKELGILLILITMTSVIFGYLVFLSEIDAIDTHFRSIPDGCWWGLVTLTTVGYGDMYPKTYFGKLLGVSCAVIGILIVALPVPIISNNFTRIYDLVGVVEYQNHLNKEEALKENALANRRNSYQKS